MAGSIIQALRDYFLECPLLVDNRINVDYLPEDTKRDGMEVSIDPVPAESVIRQYKNGGGRDQYVFVIGTVNDYGQNTLQNIENSGLYEELSKWLRVQSRQRKLPKLPAGLEALSIEAQSPGYLFSAYADVAKYQIQCRIVFYRKGDR